MASNGKAQVNILKADGIWHANIWSYAGDKARLGSEETIFPWVATVSRNFSIEKFQQQV